MNRKDDVGHTVLPIRRWPHGAGALARTQEAISLSSRRPRVLPVIQWFHSTRSL